MSWKCQLQRSSEQKVDGFDGITVGEVLALDCQGDSVELQNRDQIQFVPPKDKPLAYKILEIKELSTTGGKFLFTTYHAPQKDWSGMQFTDGASTWDVEIEGEPIVSVLPEDSGEPPVPYGPYGPFVLAWPLWIWVLLIPILLMIILPVRAIVRRVQRSSNLKAALVKRGNVAPMPAFHKAQRYIVKSLYAFRSGTMEERAQVISRMRESLADYLLGEFHILVKDDLERREERNLRNQLKTSMSVQLIKDLRLVLTEFDRAGRDLKNVDVSQAQHLLELTRVLVMNLEENRKGKRGSHGVA